MADVEFNVGSYTPFVAIVCQGGRDVTWPLMRLWSATDSNLMPRYAASAMDKEIFK
jgi:hypothetical protein